MKLEFKNIADREEPFFLLDCLGCGEEISVPERDMKTTKPVECGQCSHIRYLSYREYTLITDRFAAQLLMRAGLRARASRRDIPA
ncbi:hypothetical protein [Geobacter sp. DSM 9736]|uniref:hypothetical protein n=1 Tax=Geobacter sp. DSM 9736 TaxID=1277350 RepID=UPI000B509EE6|nr:hypothetical protein [Geobacter sp. DSM 9736]SNB46815.1 hypothetical protein SAMN06269301_2285 [Geobacter sp. DSM 9736]